MKNLSMPRIARRLLLPLCAVLCLAVLNTLYAAAGQDGGKPSTPSGFRKGRWAKLFNGRNLDGWTPKITGYPLGENYGDTFRVENSVLKVAYDKYDTFGGKFGHLYYRHPFGDYRLRIEYRFVGEQAKGGPGWATRNSGVMIHSQTAPSMRQAQDFPVSIEVQFLGGDGKNARPTGNLCTPGTNVEMNGKVITDHCTSSRSKTFHGDQWVTAEVEVRGDSVKHFINGETVLEYQKPQLDERDADAKKLIPASGDKILRGGYIALQAESHPVEFRRVEIMPL